MPPDAYWRRLQALNYRRKERRNEANIQLHVKTHPVDLDYCFFPSVKHRVQKIPENAAYHDQLDEFNRLMDRREHLMHRQGLKKNYTILPRASL